MFWLNWLNNLLQFIGLRVSQNCKIVMKPFTNRFTSLWWWELDVIKPKCLLKANEKHIAIKSMRFTQTKLWKEPFADKTVWLTYKKWKINRKLKKLFYRQYE